MSRRYRIEEEKAQQLTQDFQEEEDKLKLQKERIFGAIIWRRISEGIKIQDLKPDLYEAAIDMIEKIYLPEAVVFKNSNILKDPESLKSFREKLLFNMKDQCSIVAVDESKGGTLVGILLLKVMNKCDYGRVFSRTQMGEGKSYQSIQAFFNYLNRNVDIFEHFHCEIYLRYYLLCIKPEYRGKSIGFQLMDTALTVANHLNISIIMGIFDSYQLQRLAGNTGMKILYEQEYVSWVDKSGELRFCDPGAGNYACAVMGGEIIKLEASPRAESPRISTSEDLESSPTRAEKRKMLKNKQKIA